MLDAINTQKFAAGGIVLDDSTGSYLRILGVTFTQNSVEKLTVDDYYNKISDFSNPQYEDNYLVSPQSAYNDFNNINKLEFNFELNKFNFVYFNNKLLKFLNVNKINYYYNAKFICNILYGKIFKISNKEINKNFSDNKIYFKFNILNNQEIKNNDIFSKYVFNIINMEKSDNKFIFIPSFTYVKKIADMNDVSK